jgi:polar amino acid transport system substrate-binding protein
VALAKVSVGFFKWRLTMRRFELFAITAVVVVAACFLGWLFQPGSQKAPPALESRLPKIINTGEIRCSYLIYSPYFRKDPNTAELSGIFHDLMEEIGKKASLKINWVEEVGYENIFAGLDSGRYDVFAGGLWPNATRAKAGSFSIPVFYSVIKAWGRANETRFTALAGINTPTVRIATIDGAMEDIIAQSDYPKATRVSLPQLSPFTQNLLNITSSKADITFAEPGIIREFLVTNTGTLKELAPDRPLRIFGNCLVLKRGDTQLKEFLDAALAELLYSGAVDRILQKYEPGPGVFPRAALPYRPETAILATPTSQPSGAKP